MAVLKARKVLDDIRCAAADEKTGVDILRRALLAPIKQIAENSGLAGSIVADKVVTSTEINYGYDALSGKYCDLVEAGVIVPTKVERVALQNAASVAGLLLTTDAMVSDLPERKRNWPAGGGAGMDMDEDMY